MSHNILIIDDDMVISNALKSALIEKGYTVDLATDGTAGLHQSRAEKYQAILVDQFMPGTDGVSVLKGIRESSKNARSKLFAISAYFTSDMEQACKDYQATQLVKVSGSVNEIIDVIASELEPGQVTATVR